MNKNEKIVAVPQVFMPKDGSRPRSIAIDFVRESAMDDEGKYRDYLTSIQVMLIQTEDGLMVIKRLSDLVQRIIHFTNQSQRDVYALLEEALEVVNQDDQPQQPTDTTGSLFYYDFSGESAGD